MFYAPEFWFKTYKKVLVDMDDNDQEKNTDNTVVIFYHAEAEDLERKNNVISKCIKNIKWIAGKFETKNIVLHSFGHLSSSKAPVEFTISIISDIRDRLINTGYIVTETPFGYLNEWKLHVAGESLAKVFKDI